MCKFTYCCKSFICLSSSAWLPVAYRVEVNIAVFCELHLHFNFHKRQNKVRGDYTMRYSEEEKRTLVSLYYNGKPVIEICQEHQISRSTFYSWIQAYRPVKSKNSPRTVTPKDFDSLLRRCEKQEQIITVLKSVLAVASATTQEKLAVLEPLYGQFSVHVLCEALDIPRGTFYNHIKRNKRGNSSYARHREELRTAIQEIFEESRQTFGSEKICAVLHERGY